MDNTFDNDLQRAREWYIGQVKETDYNNKQIDTSSLLEIIALLTVIGRDIRKLVENESG